MDSAGTIFDIYGGDSNRIESYYRSPSAGAVFIKVNGSSQAVLNSGQTEGKRALGYKTNDSILVTDGAIAGTDTICLIPNNVVSLHIGGLQGGNVQLNRAIKKLAYYPARLTNAQLQALTEG